MTVRLTRKGCVRLLAFVSVLVIIVTLRGCFFRPATNYPGSHFNRGHNAAWLGVEWSMEQHTAEEVAALADQLRRNEIATAYVYTSYLKPNGTFNLTYNHAQEFVANLKKSYPEVDVQAWLGIPAQTPPGTPGPSGYVDLADETVRAKIAELSRLAVIELGFDGVHLDPEPVVSGNPHLLQLLEEVRNTIRPARLSIAGREITPFLPEADLIINRWFTWRADYYREIAKRVDQIAVMTYDSHAPSSFWYEQWMRHQVVNLTSSLKDSSAGIFIGIPTSEEQSTSHNPAAENMQTGLTGLLAGLNDLDSHPERIRGVAIYPYWETTDDEWTTYRSWWLGREQQK